MNRLWPILLLAGSLIAQQPRLANAKLETRSAAGGLEKEFRALLAGRSGPAWVGYAVPAVAGEHQMCCSNSNGCCGACVLEDRARAARPVAPPGPVRLESPPSILALFRIDQTNVEKIRTFSLDCELDIGGLPFYWFTDVRPVESIAWLTTFALSPEEEKERRNRLSEPSVAAIALHSDPAADQALERFVAAGQPERLRERAAFWLGSARGKRGYEVLRTLLANDPSDRLREKAVFALSVSKEPEAIPAIVEVAKNDRSAHVRGQALFWLAQKAGKKEAAVITEAIEKDPNTEVKKRAVFALSQLPKEEGVPLLIQVARTNRNPVARKQAMFWLGQSKDPRALGFFEEILTK